MAVNTFDAMTQARASLIRLHPFFGVLALQMEYVANKPGISTMATDGSKLYYNEQWISGLSVAEVRGVICHELLHAALHHTMRVGSRKKALWNIACDYAINPMVLDGAPESIKLPPGGCLNMDWKDKSAEEIYDLLIKNGEEAPGDFIIDLMDGEFVSEAEALTQEARWNVALTQAAIIAQQAGNLPGAFKRLIDQISTPKVDWRAQLRALLTEFSPQDFSWARPNRRHLSNDLILPSLTGASAGKIVCVIDTSGSISDEILQRFGSEIVGIRDSVMPSTLEIIYCDAHIDHIDTFENGDEVCFEMHGGGGTDFRPPFAHIEKADEMPKCLVYLTDGYGPFPGQAPNYPVIWAMISEVQPPWGQIVKIGD